MKVMVRKADDERYAVVCPRCGPQGAAWEWSLAQVLAHAHADYCRAHG